jgi:hypothetical protein
MKVSFFVFALFCFLPFVNAQEVKMLSLKQEHIAFIPKNFYVSDLVDDRKEKDSVGYFLIKGQKKVKLNFRDGAARSMMTFIALNVTQDRSKQAMIVHITKMDFAVKQDGPNRSSSATADVSLAFYVGDKKILEMGGTGSQTSDTGSLSFVEEYVRKAVENTFTKFDDWWGKNGSKIPTAATVKVNATIGKVPSKSDYIVFSLHRPLSITDFTGNPPTTEGMELASTMSAIGMQSGGQTKNSQIVIDVVFTPYFEKSRSWFKDLGKNPRVLAHEQTHFSIMAIKACELVNKISATVFQKDTYEKQIEAIFKQYVNLANDEETKFDAETNHNTIADKEKQWEKKVSDQAKAAGCY